MKNLLIYVNPSNTFFGKETGPFRDCTTLVKIQIDNSLSLGWDKKDILLVTNFEYEYSGVKSLVIDGSSYCPFRPLSTKTLAVHFLLKNNLLDKNQLYWVHDFDAFQLHSISESELNLGDADLGLTDYGWGTKWCLGSIFFKPTAQDIFQAIKDTVYKYQIEDERALTRLTTDNTKNILSRVKRLNITYNFGMRHIGTTYKIVTKPIKIIHFHPDYKVADRQLPASPLNMFMYGKNELGVSLMTPQLKSIFNSHGIK